MATMDDIARALGVTKGTVSKALSGAEDVGETTRKLVLEKAVERYAPELTPDFTRVRRLELLDAEGKIFR